MINKILYYQLNVMTRGRKIKLETDIIQIWASPGYPLITTQNKNASFFPIMITKSFRMKA